MNPIRIRFIKEKLAEVRAWDDSVRGAASKQDHDAPLRDGEWDWLQGLECLDVGCGAGLLTESLARASGRVHGIDASSSNIHMAISHASQDPALHLHPSNGASKPWADGHQASLSYQHITAEDLLAERSAALSQDEAQYDVVTAMEVIEHVNQPAQFLQTLTQLVKPGGHLFLSTIARTPLSYLLTILVAERALDLVSRGTHNHSQYIDPSELVGFFSDTKVGWIRPKEEQRGNIVPTQKLLYESRGVAYLPWKGIWQLAPRWTKGLPLNPSEQANYFFWIRRPV
ncbi:Methyltransferases [Ceraceosorus bombacis]|uniref:Methyltransferases n=1 Tax=Ceraceosorus bombacis TaxID=401625 RepID=A0A0P1BT88_9BASI|nr:Methyltransferases [Ceraceosorus bombacis]